MKYVIGSINWTMFGTGYDYNNSLEHLVQGMKQQGLGEIESFHSVCIHFKSIYIPQQYISQTVIGLR